MTIAFADLDELIRTGVKNLVRSGTPTALAIAKIAQIYFTTTEKVSEIYSCRKQKKFFAEKHRSYKQNTEHSNGDIQNILF